MNRIHRAATALRPARRKPHPAPAPIPPQAEHLAGLARLVEGLVAQPLLAGNRVDPLENGDEAYPAMLEAIGAARRRAWLSTYIFETGRAGDRFIAALGEAAARGVDARVIIDAVGARYSWPPASRALRRAGVRVASFLPTLIPWKTPYLNMRNHRKLLVVDDATGFTGGLNIRDGHWLALSPAYPTQDLHFRIDGPAVAQMAEVFAEDWQFCTGETLPAPPPGPPCGPVAARGIPDGPDADLDNLRLTLHGAIECARSSLRVLTPYFLPDQALITALNVAAMTGIEVDIVLPERGNLKPVEWAAWATVGQLLPRCRVWLSPPPFDHSKLVVVDGLWTLLGSTNWDPRSLRLNFEFNLECYDSALGARMARLIDEKIRRSRRLTLEEVESRPLPVRLRDGAARLFSPYL